MGKTIADTVSEAVNNGQVGESAVLAALAAGGVISNAKAAITALADLTGTVGTANSVMTALAALSASTLATDFATQKTSLDAVITAINTKLVEINNNLADLQAKVNAIHAALKA